MGEMPILSNHGCRLNAYEAHAMEAMAREAGVDAVIVNTCAVTSEAVAKARRDIRRLRRDHPGRRIVVTGCAAQTDPDAFAAMDEVDVVLGNADKMRPATWSALGTGDSEPVVVDDIMSVTETASHLIDGFGTRSRAYVQVQNGCDHRCTFCIIPFGRGNSRSVPAGVVVEQVARLVDRGFQEVVLTGVDLTSWGADLPGAPRLGDLCARILKLTEVARLRISSIDSIEVDDALMRLIAEEGRLMPHLHLSLQHGHDLILKRMKRRHSRADAVRFCAEARRLRPDMTFGADLIAGFPTETEDHHAANLSLVEACGLTWLHVFPYSPRPGTPAARMPAVDGRAIKARAAELRAAGAAAEAAHLAGQVGRTHRVLMESPRMGRTEQFAPVRFGSDRAEGAVVPAAIDAVADGALRAA
ncbi:tRNA (N(6)-L-threonylcarbamoyladenosine(37)-C(2))-methylthiotransferase MtaB [Jannaschia sp. Os4]|uniref:tRNA (N(6)-L-threonylcarbamoyladenosine(37)-C(2))- methylthiotransferase MtaB n=1 Tax=Jannaschia sp. Os4 TaxID=2807617 RepID=UPI0019394EC1|nr:tRNA (N(6)-L-threonylcarbamoyladenosine(37)-C(2))-methylthiotransferase MtaB [Jannaschia sp. Os4]MBM2575454.1 tRNA (N(6)-L-threonylcarbamoyladenosine(37)-C(2))-methylthiotransferase MtaB [Jannaschia sp. Os4]